MTYEPVPCAASSSQVVDVNNPSDQSPVMLYLEADILQKGVRPSVKVSCVDCLCLE